MDRETKKRLLRAVGVLLGLFLACVVLLALGPSCLILETTGYYCAGCGGQRMISALLEGDLLGAFRHNPFLFFVLPLAGAYALAEAVRYVRGKPPLFRSRRFAAVLSSILILALVFTILRNLPGFGFLGPG